jgi:opacity protein-like surface antigen
VSYVVLPRLSRFRPFATAGAGATLFYIHESSKNAASTAGLRLRDSWKLTFNWGGGVEYLIADRVGLSFSVKDQISGIPSYGLPTAIEDSQHGVLQNWQVGLGLAIHWDEW